MRLAGCPGALPLYFTSRNYRPSRRLERLAGRALACLFAYALPDAPFRFLLLTCYISAFCGRGLVPVLRCFCAACGDGVHTACPAACAPAAAPIPRRSLPAWRRVRRLSGRTCASPPAKALSCQNVPVSACMPSYPLTSASLPPAATLLPARALRTLLTPDGLHQRFG